jgi:hypothetical protein
MVARALGEIVIVPKVVVSSPIVLTSFQKISISQENWGCGPARTPPNFSNKCAASLYINK